MGGDIDDILHKLVAWLDPDDNRRPVYLNLNPNYHGFNLGYASNGWNDNNALVGSPQLSLFFRFKRKFFF